MFSRRLLSKLLCIGSLVKYETYSTYNEFAVEAIHLLFIHL